ncbi:Ldh family oxidoreductase [Candidatus Peregrinibacteria bacterium]|nr:Ldh family oxidoreductase [Candidatus Peregrinibacteria bacterium]
MRVQEFTQADLEARLSAGPLPGNLANAMRSIHTCGDAREQLEQTQRVLVRLQQYIEGLRTATKANLCRDLYEGMLIGHIQAISSTLRAQVPRVTVPYMEARDLVADILYRGIRHKTGSPHRKVNDLWGDEDEPLFTAGKLTRTQAQGKDSHGSIRGLRYDEAIRTGAINPAGRVEVTSKKKGALGVDGGKQFGQVVAQMLMQNGLERMKDGGQGAIILIARNANHAGRAQHIVEPAVEKGFACHVAMNVTEPGHRTALEPDGTEAFIGTNPHGYGIPTMDETGNLYCEGATTETTEGNCKVSSDNGLPVPYGFVHTHDRRPTTDPGVLYRSGKKGFVLPHGSDYSRYKGGMFGIGVELFVDAASGATEHEVLVPAGNNIFATICEVGKETHQLLSQRVAAMANSPTVSHEPVRLPSRQGKRKLEEARQSGVTIAEKTWNMLLKRQQELRRE